MTSIRMLIICDKSLIICKSLVKNFRTCLENNKLLSEWKKSQYGFYLQKNHEARVKELSPHFFTACFRKNTRKDIL